MPLKEIPLPEARIPGDPLSAWSRIHALRKEMPELGACRWMWTTTRGLRVKRLFEAVRHIVLEGRLVITPEKMTLVPQKDVKECIEVGFVLFRLDLQEHGTFKLMGEEDDDSLMIPLNIDEWGNAVRTIRADDTVGICVTKESVAANKPTIDLYIKKPGLQGNCFQFHCRWLDEEYMHFGVSSIPPVPITCKGRIELDTVEFKRLLTSTSTDSMMLKFGPTWTDFVAIVNKPGNWETNMSMRVAHEPKHCWGCEEIQPNQLAHMGSGGCLEEKNDDDLDDPAGDVIAVETEPYGIIKLLRTTKCAKLADRVMLLYYKDRPLLIQYKIKGWGQLEYQVYPERQIPAACFPAAGVGLKALMQMDL